MERTTYAVYGIKDCSYCRRAVHALQASESPYAYNLVEEVDKKSFLDERGFTGGDRTFPRVYQLVGGEEVLVGGFTELEDRLLGF